MVNETANVKITLNSTEAQQQLEELQNEMKRLIVLKKKAEEAGDVEGYKKIDANIKSVNRNAQKLVKEHQNLEQVLKNINGASMNELRTAQKALTAQTDKLTRGTKEYIEKSKQLKLVKDEIAGINGQYRAQAPFLTRAADGFNRYFAMATAAIASFTGIALTVKSSVNAFAEFDDKLSDVQKTTGLTKDQVKSLSAELEKLNTRTSQEGLLELARIAGKLGISAEKDVLGFVRAADKINVALTQDLGGNTEQAINDLGKLVDIFKLKDTYGVEASLLKVGSAINSLGAAGTANEAYLVEFSKRIAGIAPSAGISIQKVLGLAATLDELGQTSEVSGTVVNNVIAAMFKDTAEYAKIAGIELSVFTNLLNTDANEAFIKVLEGAKGSGAGFAEMAVNLDKLGLDGARSTGVLAVLANNIDKLREKQAYSNDEFAKGSSIIQEFNTKNENAQASLDKAKKVFAEVQRELGERLTPAYTSVIHKGSLLLKTTGAIVEFLFKYGKVLATATTAIVTYTIAINAHNIATKVYNSLTSAATLVTKGFNTAIKTNPIGLLISLLTTVATGFILFSKNAGEAKKAQSEFNDVVQKGNELLTGTKTLAERSAIAKNLSKEQLSSLQSDIQSQIKQEEDFHATLLQKAKKRLDEDAELAKINEQRKQANLTQIQKINLAAQANARKIEITRELEDENKGNQQRLKNLKTYLGDVNAELKKRPVTTSGESGNTTPTATPDITPFFNADFEEKKAALRKYFDDINKIKEEAALTDPSIVEKYKTEETEGKDPALDYALKQYMETNDYKLAMNQAMYDKGLIGEQEYQDNLTRIHNEEEDARLKKTLEAEDAKQQKREKAAQTSQAIAGMATDFVMALMDLELEKAGEDEEKKKEIRKKYADINFAVTVAQIIASTALGIMQGIAQLGPIAGAIMAVLTGATGLVQLGVANTQRNKVKGYAAGKYPGLQTGMYGSEPHIAMFNEVPGYPEIVVDGFTTRKMQVNYPQIAEAIYAIRDGRRPAAFSDGKYPDSSASGSSSTSTAGGSDSSLRSIIEANTAAMQAISNIKIYTTIEDIRKGDKKFTEIQNTRGL